MLGFAVNAARSVLDQIAGVEQKVEQRAGQLAGGDDRLREAVEVLHRTASSVERNVEALESVAESLPALTDAVTRLCDQLAAALAMAAPVEAVERDVEHEVGLLGRLLHPRRRRERAAAGALSPPTPPPSAPAD